MDIISWLISADKSQEIKAFFDPYLSKPAKHVEELFDLVDLLVAKDFLEPLLFLVEKTKEKVLSAPDILDGEDILVPLLYDRLTPYLKADYTSEDIESFVDQFMVLFPNEGRNELLFRWSIRFKDIFRPYGSWEYDLQRDRNGMKDLYCSISDNYMRYLQESCGISWISAQYHSDFVFKYGLACWDLKKGKKVKRLYDFSEGTMDKAIMSITSGPFHIPDPTASLSLLNAIYYFADYLKKCNMLDGVDPEAVRKSTTTFYKDLFPSLSAYSSLTCCFNSFPFWDKEDNDTN
ncbi:MAG: hypothetical protein WD398_00325 [Cyclobacteriaceae bacterium]